MFKIDGAVGGGVCSTHQTADNINKKFWEELIACIFFPFTMISP
jgi:hypothetical protein